MLVWNQQSSWDQVLQDIRTSADMQICPLQTFREDHQA
jgi:hypothetical protein